MSPFMFVQMNDKIQFIKYYFMWELSGGQSLILETFN